jgi:hypothetical protein
MKTYGFEEVKLHSFLTSALDGGEWLVRFMPQLLQPSLPIGEEAGWAPEPVLTQDAKRTFLPLPGTKPRPSTSSAAILTKLPQLTSVCVCERERSESIMIKICKRQCYLLLCMGVELSLSS